MDMDKMNGLAAMAAELDDEVTPRTADELAAEEAAAQAADPEHQAQAWAGVMAMIGGALTMIAPELEQIYTEKACLKWGAAVVPVAQKYGWDGPGSVPEIGLLIATLPLAVPSFFLVRRRIAQLKAAKAAADEARTVENGAPAGETP